jgi:aspartyl/asparaginyl beta-hydroxylase (cupin superfamily)
LSPVERLLGGVVGANNAVVRRTEAQFVNPRPLVGVVWHEQLVRSWPDIRSEWDAFRTAGGRLPRIEDLLGEHQGNSEVWAAGLLVAGGRPVGPHLARFPQTVRALGVVPGLRSALWSVLAPGAVLPEHRGPNAGVLRYHLGVVCPAGATLSVAGHEVRYVEATGILFDDTVAHSAVNPATTERVTLFCEIERPLGVPGRWLNAAVQRALGFDRRYRSAPERAVAWDRAMNPGLD